MANIQATVRQNYTTAGGVLGLSWIDYNDGFEPAAAGGAAILIPRMVVPVPGGGGGGSAGTDYRTYLFHQTHPTNYSHRVLKPTPVNTAGNIPNSCSAASLSSCIINDWMTLKGALDGVSINAGLDMDIQMNSKRTTSTSEELHQEVNIYHVTDTSGGTGGTLLDTVVFPNVTTSYVSYASTWSVSSDVDFSTDEMLRVEVINYNTGVPV